MSFRLSLILTGLLAWPAQAQTILAGRVLDLDGGKPMADVRVALCAPDRTQHNTPPATWTDAHGRYTLTDVPPGTWCVEAVYVEHDVGYVLQSPPMPVAGGALVIHFQMPTALRERLRHTMAPTDPNPKSLSTITGQLPDGFVTNAEGAALAGSRSHFETYQTGLLRGRVTRNNKPLADARVLLPGTDRHTRTDPDGRFELTKITPGTHRLYIIHPPDTLKISALALEKGLNLMHFSFRKDNSN